MLLIDHTYFIGELSLPNIQASIMRCGVSGVKEALLAAGEKNLSIFVDKYITEYLIRLFGRELTEKFLKEIVRDKPDEIWSNLKKQLLIEIGTYKASPLANYVYYWLMRDARTKTTQAGEADPKFDNAENVSNEYKLIKAWNDMVGMTRDIDAWFLANYQDYEAYSGCYSGREIWNITQCINPLGI